MADPQPDEFNRERRLLAERTLEGALGRLQPMRGRPGVPEDQLLEAALERVERAQQMLRNARLAQELRDQTPARRTVMRPSRATVVPASVP